MVFFVVIDGVFVVLTGVFVVVSGVACGKWRHFVVNGVASGVIGISFAMLLFLLLVLL